jgi:alternate signal-mediated exported protein
MPTQQRKVLIMNTVTTQAGAGERRDRRRKALIAAVCGGALLLGGSTFALWKVEQRLTGSSVSTGKFDIKVGTVKAYDVSTDRKDRETITVTPPRDADGEGGYKITGKEVGNPSQFGMSPGDTVTVVAPFTMELNGRNLAARLTAYFDGIESLPEGVDAIKWTLVNCYGDISKMGVSSTETVYDFGNFVSMDMDVEEGFGAGTLMDAESGTWYLIAEFSMDANQVSTEDSANQMVNLAGVTLELEQTRTLEGAGFKE